MNTNSLFYHTENVLLWSHVYYLESTLPKPDSEVEELGSFAGYLTDRVLSYFSVTKYFPFSQPKQTVTKVRLWVPFRCHCLICRYVTTHVFGEKVLFRRAHGVFRLHALWRNYKFEDPSFQQCYAVSFGLYLLIKLKSLSVQKHKSKITKQQCQYIFKPKMDLKKGPYT
jgi:hypothetical protein